MSLIVRDGRPTNVCDRCGMDIGNASVAVAVVVSTMDNGNQPVTLHLGIGCGCSRRVVTTAALRWRQTSEDSPGPVDLYRPEET